MGEAVLAFLTENEIDDKGATELMGADPVVQIAVLARGPLTGARNKSAALIGRIKQESMALNGEGGAVRADVEAFISRNEIDERAANILRQQDPGIQTEVIGYGNLTSARNKSAALTGRIRKAKDVLGAATLGGVKRTFDEASGTWMEVEIEESWHAERPTKRLNTGLSAPKEPAEPKVLIPAPPGVGPLSAEYSREDDGTAEVDVAKVYDIIERRRRAQKSHDFNLADKLREELRDMMVHVNDRLKVWAVGKEPDPSRPAPPRRIMDDPDGLKLPPLMGKQEGEGGAVRCPLCNHKIMGETCLCLQALEESIQPVLAQQVKNHLKAYSGAAQAWNKYVVDNVIIPQTNRQRMRETPGNHPEKHTAAYLMGFLRHRGEAPRSGAPDHLTLSVALMSASKIDECLQICESFQDGLVPVNLLLAFNLLCKILNPPPDMTPSYYDRYPQIQMLCAQATIKAPEFSQEQLIRIIRYVARLGGKGRQYLPLAQAIEPFYRSLTIEETTRVATALSKIYGPDAAPILENIKDRAKYMLNNISWRNQLTIVLAMLKTNTEAHELFLTMVNLLIPKLHQTPQPTASLWDELIQLLVACAEHGLKHDLLLTILAERCVQNLAVFTPKNLTDIAWSFWSLAVAPQGLMAGVGEIVTRRLTEFTPDQLEKIEVAYGANGFVIPEEWNEHKINYQSHIAYASQYAAQFQHFVTQ